MWRDTDVSHVLPLIQAPTLVLHYADDQDESVDEARYIADHIPGAEFAELPGADHSLADLSVDRSVFGVAACRGGRVRPSAGDRHVHRHRRLDRHSPPSSATGPGGSWSSGTMRPCERCSAATAAPRWTPPATASSPPSTVPPAAFAVPRPSPAPSTTRDRDPRRPAHRRGRADRPQGRRHRRQHRRPHRAQATPSQVLVSQTVKDLVAGSEIHFDDIGTHQLKGITDPSAPPPRYRRTGLASRSKNTYIPARQCRCQARRSELTVTEVEDTTTTTYVTNPPVWGSELPRSDGIGLAGFICSLVGFIIPVLFFPARIICW